jgi:flagellar motor protein MotB
MSKHCHLPHLSLIVGFLVMTASAGAGQVNTAKPGEPAERHLSGDQSFREWSLAPNRSDDIKRVKVCRVETVCEMRFKEGQTPRMRVRNLVAPLRYEDETVPISEAFTKQVRQALDNMRDKQGVTVRFIGYSDDAPLTGGDESTYGNHLSLSKARAQRVALAMQGVLGLPASAIESDGRGTAQPVASNATELGRTLNRRIEVEFWYDDFLQALADGPQLCPGDIEEVVTRVYDPPWGSITTLGLANGQPIIPPSYAANLRRALTDIADRTNARLRFIGYTKNERLDRRTASVYGDDIGLSAARARRAMDIIMQDPVLSGARSEHEGHGYVQSDDVVNTGFIQGEESFVRVQVVYDERLPLDNYEGVDITRLTQELRPKSPYELNVMHITVDGKPIDDPGRSSSDVQRCTDVALDNANIQFRFDNLESRPRLAVAAHPVAVAVVNDVDGGLAASLVRFRMYNNYPSFIERAEIRIFEQQESLQAAPLEIVAVDNAGLAEWQPAAKTLAGPARELKYLLRAYDSKGNFDETGALPLWLEPSPGEVLTSDGPSPRELLAAYGESDLARHGIPLGSGTVKVQGSGIPADHTVWVAGRPVPVDPQGKFAAEEILPNGAHTVEVAVLDNAANGSLYLRDLEFKGKDLFYVGVADMTLSQNRANGPVDLLQGQNAPQPYDSLLSGRLAFYANGKVSEHWRLTTSADTREGPVKNLFSNFLDKSPNSLFRRLDPDYHYPTFGDDGAVTETAPTLGKFYAKASRGENYGLWGNFNVGYMGNELAHVDRGLYGANAHYGSEANTSFGERRIAVDGFAAEPGTIPSYEEFRGTGGSVYYLRHQDILRGSERVRIELHDKDSGIVASVVDLRYGVDYDIDYLQGRLLLSEPLSSTAYDNLLVRSTGLSGDDAYVVARYEYTPGFDKLDQVAAGGQGHYWLNDHVRLGLTANSNGGGANSNLGAADLTLRMSPDSWFKVQTGRSNGLLSSPLRSDDGGFGFRGHNDLSFTDANASAYRADVSVGLRDFFKGRDGRLTFYKQNLDAGYSAPGQATVRDTEQFGGTFKVPVTSRMSLAAKGDQKIEDLGVETRVIELDLGYKLAEQWSVSTGVRNDLRKDRSPIVPLTQVKGERTDAIAQVTFDPGASWRAYGFVQDTVTASGGREDNRRVGAGGSYRLTKRFRIDGEASDGDFGSSGKVGTNFLYSDLTNLYLNYALENERTDNGIRVRQGNLTSGMKRRLSDSSSVYLEERYQNGGSQAGLTHATGINLVAKERWNFGGSTERGTLRDSRTGAGTYRKAAGIRLGYGVNAMQLSSGVDYRKDDAEQLDATHNKRTAWLFRNNFKVQLTPDWRVLGKLDHSISDSSLGEFYAGGYTEAVVGYAYRPVRHDRLSALTKYTYFYNVPTTDQVTLQNTAVEFIQKSHIASLDLSYDLTADWSIGGKYAYRLGQASLDRIQRQFFDNAAQLAVVRADWRFRKGWESLAEVRMLDLRDLGQRRRGALAAIYRYMGQNVKVGAGYNFTDFSDDLTDLRYDHRGVFVNLVVTK